MEDSMLIVKGVGKANGENRAELATKQAIQLLLHENKKEDIKEAFIKIKSADGLKMDEVKKITSLVQDNINSHANISFDTLIDNTMGQELEVSICENASNELKIPEFLNTQK